MVCLSSRGPSPRVAAAQSRADRRSALCALVCRLHSNAARVDRADRRRRAAPRRKRLELASQLGGVVWKSKGTDVVSTIATFAKEYAITHIIMGRTQRPWYRRLFRHSILDRLMQTVRGITVIVVDAK